MDTSAKRNTDLLHVVSEATSGLTGYDLLLGLPERITTMPGMRYCFIAECADENKTRLEKGIYKLFKAAAVIKAYMRAPVISSATGEIPGHIAIANSGPVIRNYLIIQFPCLCA